MRAIGRNLLSNNSLAAIAVIAGGSYWAANDYDRNRRIVASTQRVLRLFSVAGQMSTDYGYHYYWKQVDVTRRIQQMGIRLRAVSADYYDLLAEANRAALADTENDPCCTSGSSGSKQPGLNQKLAVRLAQEKRDMELLELELVQLEEFQDQCNSELHERNAARMRDMCTANGGLYIKLGQHLAMLDHILPPEYHETLRSLLDQNPRSSLDSVYRILKEDIGVDPTTYFDRFDPVPIASASLAQVHIAWKDGKKYAIKVQHEGLREASTFDRLVITKLVDLIPHFFPDFNYAFLTKEMNLNLPLELDFREEVKNMEQARAFLRDFIATGDVAIPYPQKELCSQRVIVMTFEEGSYIHHAKDIPSLRHLRPTDIACLVSRIFSEQIFRHGFVHCDPHEANLLVRPNPRDPRKPQIVLLDHGLYRKLDDGFRRDYARLWQAIALSDKEAIRLYCQRMGAGSMYTMLSSMLTHRRWDDLTRGTIKVAPQEDTSINAAMLRYYARLYMKEIVDLLGSIPSDLLLLLKTKDCLRHIDMALGMPATSAAVTTAIAADVVLGEELSEALHSGHVLTMLPHVVCAVWTWVRLRLGVCVLQWATWLHQMWEAPSAQAENAVASVQA